MTNAERCPSCDGLLALIGVRHRCIPRIVAEISPAATPESVRGTYRYRDPEKWRAYMRDYMRKKRSKGKTNGDTARGS